MKNNHFLIFTTMACLLVGCFNQNGVRFTSSERQFRSPEIGPPIALPSSPEEPPENSNQPGGPALPPNGDPPDEDIDDDIDDEEPPMTDTKPYFNLESLTPPEIGNGILEFNIVFTEAQVGEILAGRIVAGILARIDLADDVQFLWVEFNEDPRLLPTNDQGKVWRVEIDLNSYRPAAYYTRKLHCLGHGDIRESREIIGEVARDTHVRAMGLAIKGHFTGVSGFDEDPLNNPNAWSGNIVPEAIIQSTQYLPHNAWDLSDPSNPLCLARAGKMK